MWRLAAAIVLTMSSAGCKKKVDMQLPDSGAITPTVKTTAAAETATPAAPTDDPPLATLAPTKAPPMPVYTAKPAGSNTAAAAGPQPPECDAAKVMLANGRQKEFETLKAACLSKGGKL